MSCLGPFLYQILYLEFKLKRMREIPAKRQTILISEIFSVKPNNAIPVVTIKIMGPTSASILLI